MLIRQDCSLAAATESDLLVIPVRREPLAAVDRRIVAAVRCGAVRAAGSGSSVAGLWTGAFVLGAAGLLDGLPCTTHWRWCDRLAERHPRLQAAVRATPARDWSLAAIASEAGLSARPLARRFGTETGQSPITWLVAARLTCAQELLESTGLSVEAVAHAAGFASADLLRKHFRVRYGTNPQAHRLAMRHARATGDRRSDGPPVAEVRWSRATRPDWRRPRPDRTARSRTARSARRSSAAPSVRCPVSASARRHNRAAGRTCPAR